MRFTAVARAARRLLRFPAFSEIHQTPPSILADVGYLSKGLKILATGSQSIIRRRARNAATPVRSRRPSLCAGSRGRAKLPDNHSPEPPRIPHRSSHPPDRSPGLPSCLDGLPELSVEAKLLLARKASRASRPCRKRRRFRSLPIRPAPAHAHAGIAAMLPTGSSSSALLASPRLRAGPSHFAAPRAAQLCSLPALWLFRSPIRRRQTLRRPVAT